MFVEHLPPQPIPLCVVLLVIVTASTDLVARRIPNRIVLGGLIVALLAQCWLFGLYKGGSAWLEGALAGFALLLPFYLVRGMAAGDVKLMMTIGAWVGPVFALHIVLVALLIGGLWSVVVILKRGKSRDLVRLIRNQCARWLPGVAWAGNASRAQTVPLGTLPYGVAIAGATIGVLFAAVY
ncbi:prepilin peptidase [Burkholderia sp. Ax-1719]|uniref:A24 family peptidase n=1 Tax=Burkholderia sp. Ax-1719 TaxID=2608334 RepID=UPI00141FE05F|nr:prepilin peptidase [Burkholderia sp. Ax-1719]NIE64225.1 peptidase A24 [Burkholderia sp. Ax-1719]